MRPDVFLGRPGSQVVDLFVSFPMTLILSQSDILVNIYAQNTGGCPDGLTECPVSQLQLPFQNSAESLHNKAAFGQCCPRVWTVALLLYDLPYQG
jgi:hypothetical protein